jgi:hypothetical protein
LIRRLQQLEEKEEREHSNTVHTIKTPANAWFLLLCQNQIKQRTNVPENSRNEPLHFDGDQSLLHSGLSILSDRNVVFYDEKRKEDASDKYRIYWGENTPQPLATLPSKPGSIYLGVLVGCAHQVAHAEEAPRRHLLEHDV